MSNMKLGIQLYSLRDDAAKDLAAVLQEVAEMGYDGVELAGLYGHTAEEVKTLAKNAGLEVISAHVGLDVFRKEGIEETVSLYREIGCRYIAIPHLAMADRPGAENFSNTEKEILAIAKECDRQGLKLLYHNHDFEFAKLPDGRTMLEVLYACAPESLLQTELDTCWAHIVGVDPATYLMQFAGRAPLVHLKDYKGDRPAEHYVSLGIPHTPAADAEPFVLQPVGRGVQDIPSVVNAAGQIGTEWLIVEQDDPAPGDTALDSARISAQYVRTLLQ